MNNMTMKKKRSSNKGKRCPLCNRKVYVKEDG